MRLFFSPVLALSGVLMLGVGGWLAGIRHYFGQPEPVIAYLHEDCTAYNTCNWNPAVYYTSADGTAQYAARPNAYIELDVAWSPDGSQFVFVTDTTPERPRRSLHLSNANGTEVRQLTEGLACRDDFPRWSPDGSTIAFVRRCNQAFNEQLILMDMASGTSTEIYSGSLFFGGPVWMPDSTAILLAVEGAEHFEIMYIDTQTGTATLVTSNTSGGRATYPAPSPDGDYIAYRGWQDFEQWVSVLDRQTNEQVVVSGPRGFAVQHQWSPDGEWVYYLEQDFDYTLMRVRPDGRSLQALMPNVWQPVISPDGQQFAVLLGRSQLTVLDIETQTSQQLPTPSGNTLIARWVPVASRGFDMVVLSVLGLLTIGLGMGVGYTLTIRGLTSKTSPKAHNL